MSEFYQVGLTAMRDPKTGEILPAVPLYIEAVNGELPELPEINRMDFAREIIRKVKAAKTAEKEKKGA